MGVTLYKFDGSNAVLTVQLMLARKRLEYRSVDLPPGLHVPALRLLGFPGRTVPALKVDGRRVQGSRAIAQALDELVPNPPLFPSNPVARARVLEAEAWGEEFQDAVRRIFYCAARRDPDAFRRVMVPGQPPAMQPVMRAVAPFVLRLASWAHAATDAAGAADVAQLPARLDRIDGWISAGVLDGPRPNAADFQIGVNVAALLLSADAEPFIRGRPAERLAHRVAPGYTGPLGRPLPAGTIPAGLPPEWLAAARAGAPAGTGRAAPGGRAPAG